MSENSESHNDSKQEITAEESKKMELQLHVCIYEIDYNNGEYDDIQSTPENEYSLLSSAEKKIVDTNISDFIKEYEQFIEEEANPKQLEPTNEQRISQEAFESTQKMCKELNIKYQSYTDSPAFAAAMKKQAEQEELRVRIGRSKKVIKDNDITLTVELKNNSTEEIRNEFSGEVCSGFFCSGKEITLSNGKEYLLWFT